MHRLNKTFSLTSFKAVSDGEAPGTFEAVVAVFDNVDRAGEVITKGAFTKSLENGLPPVIFSHDWMSPPIGVTLSAKETDEGLLVKGRLFVDENEDSPLARQVYTALKAKGGDGRPALREFSVGLNVKESSEEVRDEEKVVILSELDLIEWGPCLKGVNPSTRLVSVKSETERQLAEALATETSSADADKQRIARSDAPAPNGALTQEDKRKLLDVLF